MVAAPVLVIKVNDKTVCSSNVPCTHNASLITTHDTMTISGHIANCRPNLVLEIALNGLDIGGEFRQIHNNQGYCQASIQKILPIEKFYSINFVVVENENTYELAYWKNGRFLI